MQLSEFWVGKVTWVLGGMSGVNVGASRTSPTSRSNLELKVIVPIAVSTRGVSFGLLLYLQLHFLSAAGTVWGVQLQGLLVNNASVDA